jgi:osmotically inducible protein OsmC
MPVRSAEAQWNGNLREGNGTMKTGSGAYDGAYSFGSRFESAQGSNPEELIAAAHAGCFSMAFAAGLTRAGFSPTSVHTTAKVHIEPVEGGFGITRIELDTEAKVPGIENAQFQEQAEAAKKGCPVSKALAAVENITLSAKLVS